MGLGYIWRGFRGLNLVFDLERGLEIVVIVESDYLNDLECSVWKEVLIVGEVFKV